MNKYVRNALLIIIIIVGAKAFETFLPEENSLIELPYMDYIYVNSMNTMAVDENGYLWMWGDNSYLQVDLDERFDHPLRQPRRVMSDVAVAKTHDFTCAALKKDGSLWMWGSNYASLLGYRGSKLSIKEARKVMDDVLAFDIGFSACMAINEKEELWVWGYLGEVKPVGGILPEEIHKEPIKVAERIINIAIGNNTYYVVAENGDLYAWGDNEKGQLGIGHTEASSEVHRVLSDVVQVEASSDHCLALKSDGSVWAWGENKYGCVGTGQESQTNDSIVATPTKVFERAVKIAVGRDNSMAITQEGDLWLWGKNSIPEIDYLPHSFEYFARANNIPTYSEEKVVNMAADSFCSFMIKEDGSLWTWGIQGASSRHGIEEQSTTLLPRRVIYGIR